MALSDAYEKGLLKDLSAFDHWCDLIARQIGGQGITSVHLEDERLPVVIRKTLEALLSGLTGRNDM